MRLRLEPRPSSDDVAVFAIPPLAVPGDALQVAYDTRTGAVLRVDGNVRGAFDRAHHAFALSREELAGSITLEVERRAMPSTGLPPGDGRVWRKILAEAEAEPSRRVTVDAAAARPASRPATPEGSPLPLVGHSHLDVAWLWRFEETRRKTVRTFATACRQLDADPGFVFAFSQPQLYAWLLEDEPELFERVRAHVRSGRIDASVAPMWVESDCNLPSGESLLRQLVYGTKFAREILGVEPSVAWLPDSFGFANTLPTLLEHAGIGAFGTTKLGWNDTNAFPFAQFVWEGPDGARVVAAQIASIQGEFAPSRLSAAAKRGDPLLVGHGDGGGGVSDEALRRAPAHGRWTSLGAWFRTLRDRPGLPVWRDELYLEEHRGTYTTHHDVKARNARLERALDEAELLGAWALALHASRFFLDEFRAQLAVAWEIVLRAQFHDILPGSAIGGVYDDVHAEYDRAEALIAAAAANARAVLPRARERARLVTESDEIPLAVPVARGRTFGFENAHVRATVRADGTLVALHGPADERGVRGPNLVRRANRLVAYADRPKRWEAWNVDRGYRRRRRRVEFREARVEDGALVIALRLGSSVGVMRISLGANEPVLRVELALAWSERGRLLRVENETRLAGARLRFGSPHGTIERRLAGRDALERARFEVPGQRFARVDAAGGPGFALLSLDGYGWSAHAGRGAAHVGHSLLRGTSWPDPDADRGEHLFRYAFAPLVPGDGVGVLEARWRAFAGMDAVPMFTSDDPAVLVVATKPADDGDGVVVRIRECDGAARRFSLRCGARARAVRAVDVHERERPGEIALVDGSLEGEIGAFALRSFRVGLA